MLVEGEKLVLIVRGVYGLSSAGSLFVGVCVDKFGLREVHGKEIC